MPLDTRSALRIWAGRADPHSSAAAHHHHTSFHGFAALPQCSTVPLAVRVPKSSGARGSTQLGHVDHPRAYGQTRARLPRTCCAPDPSDQTPAQRRKLSPVVEPDSPTIMPGAPDYSYIDIGDSLVSVIVGHEFPRWAGASRANESAIRPDSICARCPGITTTDDAFAALNQPIYRSLYIMSIIERDMFTPTHGSTTSTTRRVVRARPQRTDGLRADRPRLLARLSRSRLKPFIQRQPLLAVQPAAWRGTSSTRLHANPHPS